MNNQVDAIPKYIGIKASLLSPELFDFIVGKEATQAVNSIDRGGIHLYNNDR